MKIEVMNTETTTHAGRKQFEWYPETYTRTGKGASLTTTEEIPL